MSEAIKREDIRKGDKVRQSFDYTASADGAVWYLNGGTFELIERPVMLPTVKGWYQGSNFPLSKGCSPYCLNDDGSWGVGGATMTPEYMRRHAGELTLLRPVAEVAAEVLTEIKALVYPGSLLSDHVDALATKWVTK